jgi:hypothetical protein
MKGSATPPAARQFGECREVAIEDKQLLMEPGVGQHGLVQGFRPLN